MSGREVAWRMLAHEYSQSVEEERATEERAASYVLSPLGARVNRVLLVGTLGPSEAIGRDAEAPFYRSRLDDPTGSITVTAGSFQPRAMEAIRTVSAPTEAMVVGKAHVFRGRDGTAYPSVRAESVRPVSAEEYRALLAEAVAQTLRRLALTREIAGGSTDEALRAAGFPTGWIRSARAA
ncbi:MAG TPA: hypothetical protein VLY85_00405, partial [Thermoplasmata archaeon]|nr:hypothetical protein [Thermoplasmata archaeon]